MAACNALGEQHRVLLGVLCHGPNISGPGSRRRTEASTHLSKKDLEVLGLVAEGLSDREIADRLMLSAHTVHRHVANIRTKLRQPSRTAAAAKAVRDGII